MRSRRLFSVTTLALSMCLGGAVVEAAHASDFKYSCATPSRTMLAQKAAPGAKFASAEQFLKAYYQAMQTAKGPQDVEPFMADEVKSKMKVDPQDAAMIPLFVEMLHSTHPAEVKVVSQKAAGDRTVFQLSPVKVPEAVSDMAKEPTFKMTGEAIVVKQHGEFRIYKDYWVAEAKGKDGNSKMSFGTDPDKKEADERAEFDKSAMSSNPSDQYANNFRDALTGKWKQTGVGKKIYASMKVGSDGQVSDIDVHGEDAVQKEAEEQIRTLIGSTQPLPVPPPEMADKPYVWMMFDWSESGRCISGPYFGETKR